MLDVLRAHMAMFSVIAAPATAALKREVCVTVQAVMYPP